MNAKLYNQKGEEVGQAELPADIFEVAVNPDLLHQAVVAQMANSRQVLAHTKDRSEVRGGGRKPWRQKGTGRARHGSIRSPIWRGGGVTFGPTKERVFTQKINQKMKKKALFMALSSKVKDEQFLILDKLELIETKTRAMAEIFKNLEAKLNQDFIKSALIVLPQTDLKMVRAINNLPKIRTIRADSLNVVDVLSFKHLILLAPAIEVIKKTYLRK
ncbi:MAG: 50S ribosomal protein L4 [bacterium]